jgi:hypothetical protein
VPGLHKSVDRLKSCENTLKKTRTNWKNYETLRTKKTCEKCVPPFTWCRAERRLPGSCQGGRTLYLRTSPSLLCLKRLCLGQRAHTRTPICSNASLYFDALKLQALRLEHHTVGCPRGVPQRKPVIVILKFNLKGRNVKSLLEQIW